MSAKLQADKSFMKKFVNSIELVKKVLASNVELRNSLQNMSEQVDDLHDNLA